MFDNCVSVCPFCTEIAVRIKKKNIDCALHLQTQKTDEKVHNFFNIGF